MRVFRLDDLSYYGRHEHAMEWDHPSTSHPYYWHPDWLQNAEDLMGLYPDNSHPTSANPDE
ncbi:MULTISPECIES: hypothetical protein [Vibrio]|uniref:hypothetical protein n=1 Tax=Vibrio TaxID=662 RepID=UPI001268C6A7|nr:MULTISPECIES: hypothetical protein [Vibrio]MCM5509650.1 hypothetical protein [Vibrio sp. SCSIO 43169]MDE3895939.1 hypothetical protein [Vibrio sp. CC007]NRF15139.1 hypothetical protein [Vibrio coralliilyticus]QFT36090.1 hypothetical protein FIU99_06580 [Vibrio sp. THAF64]QGM33990.1 hypothetical protein GGC04_06590 [Vibrio sp. THAF191d]